jgi:polyhydroxyalkanoate synthesis regulator protein
MIFFSEAMRMFSPFAQRDAAGAKGKAEEQGQGENPGDLQDLKRQMAEMQAKLDKLTSK